ncbi:MAG TPA: zinc-ribbon domain-containing protein [Pyrinomonadaceae bacterium]|nr:zinc-ribbon domain-containing protein [Pyrinomonadaceae bacterium]
MFCPNCGNKNSVAQRFCRSCGFGLEKVAQSLSEQVPTRIDLSLAKRKERLQRFGMAALSIFGLGVLSFIGYSLFYKLMISQGQVLAALGALAFIIVLGSGLLSVILFAKANEVKELPAREIIPEELTAERSTNELLSAGRPSPPFSVTDRTTNLLPVTNEKDQSTR